MPISKPKRHSPRAFRQTAVAWVVAALTLACSLSDYSYLGAQRKTNGTSGGRGGTTETSATSQPSRGGTGGFETSPQGGTATSRSTKGSGATSGWGTVDTSSVVQEGGATTTLGSAGASASSDGGEANGGGTTSTPLTETVSGGNGGGGNAPNGGNATTTPTSTIGSGGTGTGGTSTTVGTGGATPPSTCPGCAVLKVPFTAKGQSARYLMLFTPMATVNEHATSGTGGSTSATVTSEGTMKALAFAPLLGNTQYQFFVQQDTGSYAMCFSGAQPMPTEVSTGWITLEWKLGSCATDTSIGRLGLDLIADNATSAPVPSATTLWLGSIWIELKGNVIVGPFGFDSAGTVNASAIPQDYNQSYGALYLRPSNPTPPSGSTIEWRSN